MVGRAAAEEGSVGTVATDLQRTVAPPTEAPSTVAPLTDRRPPRPTDRAWTDEAVRKLRADANRSADTHLIKLDLPAGWDVDIYLKDESTHPTGDRKSVV